MVILGLGTNKGNRLHNLRTALYHLKLIENFKVTKISSVYKSNALLPNNAIANQNQFYLNIAIHCKTTMEPLELLTIIKKLEIQLGRTPTTEKWVDRIIDIDILAWLNKNINTSELTIPHKELQNRPFAVWPFIDVTLSWQKYIKEQNIINTIIENLNKWGTKFFNHAPLNTHQINHRIDIPQILGILNITPDSFSDGGKHYHIDTALKHAIDLFNAGADIIDIGAESTRPNATAVSEEIEWQRLYPVLKSIINNYKNNPWKPQISIDTRHYNNAHKAISLGIDIINDVSGLSDINMCKLIAETNVHAIYMHNLGIPANRNQLISIYKNPVKEVLKWATKRKLQILKTGLKPNKLIFDPGLGFGKNPQQNLQILKQIHNFHDLEIPLLVGHSRKSFLELANNKPSNEKDYETAVISEFLARKKIQYLRVHNVEHNIRNLTMQTLIY